MAQFDFSYPLFRFDFDYPREIILRFARLKQLAMSHNFDYLVEEIRKIEKRYLETNELTYLDMRCLHRWSEDMNRWDKK